MITCERTGDVGVVSIDRHQRRNALDAEHCDALRHAVETAVEAGARAVVLTGRGTTFSAGADLDGVYDESFRRSLYAMLHGVADCPVPTIAAVNGPAIGAGTQLAVACDLRVAATSAVLAVPTARQGLAVDPWTVRRLAELAGAGTARALLIGGERIDAHLAHHRGLVDRIGGLEEAIGWAREIAGFAPLSLRYAKQALHGLLELAEPSSDLDAEFERCWHSEDLVEGRRARQEKRQPRFQGR